MGVTKKIGGVMKLADLNFTIGEMYIDSEGMIWECSDMDLFDEDGSTIFSAYYPKELVNLEFFNFLKLSSGAKEIIAFLPKEYTYLLITPDNPVYAFDEEPVKKESYWTSESGNYVSLGVFSKLFNTESLTKSIYIGSIERRD